MTVHVDFIVNKNLLIGIKKLDFSLEDKLPLLKGDIFFVHLKGPISILLTFDWKVVFFFTKLHSFYTSTKIYLKINKLHLTPPSW